MHLVSSGSGFPVLFLHGMPTSSSLWSGITERLRDRFTCLAVDLPGLGRTPQMTYTKNQLEVLAEQVEQVRIELNIDKWHVVGHDAGSAVAVYYAHRYQEHVDHLVLLSPAMFPELKPFYLFRLIRAPFLGELLAPLVNAIFWNLAMPMAFETGVTDASRESVLEDFHAPFSGISGSWRLMSVLRFGDPAKLLAEVPQMLPQLHVPTMIFHGAEDKAVPKGFAQRASQLIPKSTFLELDCGHFIPLCRAERVASELRSFFSSSPFVANPSLQN